MALEACDAISDCTADLISAISAGSDVSDYMSTAVEYNSLFVYLYDTCEAYVLSSTDECVEGFDQYSSSSFTSTVLNVPDGSDSMN